MVDFSKLIRDELVRQNKSTSWLASQPGTPDEMTIHRFLNGHTELTGTTLEAILTSLSMTIVTQKAKVA